ncbi:MAG TPA: VaFE repeat-containing surface-anchored protein [Eggerthellaceae bacterium]|uniref:VaFE repeat-containing surface-anchored protein n=1 Tax=Gordonibacter pamelaeae TaxID=471189 RepID=UPI00242D0E47|nr:VaFE repeat-containing surface-anchored protein [Gordonibacter pamelaeae]HJH74322.1 VaFE repeat-containing surface-anchored protein [Eggerthellaceae bacterium]
MRTETTERIASSKIIRVVMSIALALSVCASASISAFAGESVNVTIGDDIPYAGYLTTCMYADGEVAYCADPAAATPAPGTYSKSGVSDADLIATMWFSYGAPGFDASMFPDTWYDGSGWSADKYTVASHVLLSYAYQGSKADAVFGTSGDFEGWARGELLGSTWKSIKANKGKVSTGFDAFCIHTGPGTQVLMSFTWDKGDLKVAKEDSQAGAEPQGDATLDGAKYDIVNESGRNAFVDGKYYVNGEVVKTITGHWDGDAGAFVAKTSASALPCGTYTVVESQAPEGYLVSDWSAKAEIKSDGQMVDLTGNPCGDDVIRGGVQVTKSDVELRASEALGGNSHDALETGSTLSGIEFTIANASEHKVLVSDKWFEPGDVIETIVTSWNDEAGAYTAQTAADELPYGTYTIQETKANDSYLLTDGEPKTFQVRENGSIVKATSAGGELKFFDQVIRNDLEVVKMAEDTNASLQVAFKVTNVSTGEAHVIVTDRNGNVSTASSWNKHSRNTNGNDGLLKAESIKAADMDSRAGVWFSLGEDGSDADVNDGLAALPYGKYRLEELRSDSNEGYELVTKTFVVERDSTAAKAVWMSLDDKEGPKIKTEETDKADGDHVAQASAETTLVDTVWYENLKNDGTEYAVTGTLVVKSTGEALLDADGNAITATKTFQPRQKAGEVELEFTFDSSLLAGEDIVAFESLFSEGVEVAAHADIADEGQTVHFLDIHTTAADKTDGDKLVTGTEIAVVDEVAYEDLVPGTEYELQATLIDSETGEPVVVKDGLAEKLVTGTAAFTPEEAGGTQLVELSFDGTDLGGKSLVVYEKLFAADVLLASHEDPSDDGQTVTVAEIDTTLVDAGDGDHVIASGKVKLTDAIEYKGLVPGDTYTAHGTLIVKSTGMPLEDADGKPVTATAEFSPDKADGAADVSFEFDASKIEEGVELVAFEECLDVNGNVVAVHQDIDDDGQTVVVDNPDTPEVPDEPGKALDKTGVDLAPIAAIVVISFLAGSGCLAYGLRKRRLAAAADANSEDYDSGSDES